MVGQLLPTDFKGRDGPISGFKVRRAGGGAFARWRGQAGGALVKSRGSFQAKVADRATTQAACEKFGEKFLSQSTWHEFFLGGAAK
jgi:hypothetical protein